MTFDLLPYLQDPLKQVLQFRFIAQDNGANSLVEALVDDFLLDATFDISGVENLGVRFVTGLNQISPNPANPTAQISYRLAQTGAVKLAVFDAAGRQVASLANAQQSAGEYRVMWNGTDDTGHPVASGTYFCRLQADGKTCAARMVLLK